MTTLEAAGTTGAEVEVIDVQNSQTWLRIIMHEGRKRQIREIGGMLGQKVKHLERIRIGPLQLGDLKSGNWRHLTAGEVAQLRAVIDKPANRKPIKEGRPRKPIDRSSARPTTAPGARPARATARPDNRVDRRRAGGSAASVGKRGGNRGH